MRRFQPSVQVLPPPQRRVWEELSGHLPPQFVMYGGTALALRLAHRTSVDFDFFSSQPFEAGELLRRLPWADEAEVTQSESKDYEDVAALIKAGAPLARMLGEARAVYGDRFNSLITLKALAYFDDGDLWRLSAETKKLLASSVAAVGDIPQVSRVSDQLAN